MHRILFLLETHLNTLKNLKGRGIILQILLRIWPLFKACRFEKRIRIVRNIQILCIYEKSLDCLIFLSFEFLYLDIAQLNLFL